MASEYTSDALTAVIADVQGLPGPAGPMGPMGPAGPAGAPGRDADGATGETAGRGTADKTSVPCKSCGALSGSRVVVPIGGGMVDAASALNRDHAARIIGVTLNAVSLPGHDVEVLTQGVLEDDSLTLIPLLPVYVGPTGGLTQTPDAASWAYVRQVGIALSTSRVMVDLMTPILTS